MVHPGTLEFRDQVNSLSYHMLGELNIPVMTSDTFTNCYPPPSFKFYNRSKPAVLVLTVLQLDNHLKMKFCQISDQ